MRSSTLVIASAAAFLLATPAAFAAVTTVPQSALVPSTGYYTDTIGGGIGDIVVTTGGGSAANVGNPTGRNDDGFRGPVDLGFTLTFFGQTYNQLYINNNGNVSFNSGLSQYVPSGPQGASAPVISPYFGDADSRGANSGVVHFRTDIPNQLIVTWDRIGFFNSQDRLLNSFQLVLRGPGYNIPAGEGAIGFWYGDMNWEVTQTSQVAAVGFGDGQQNGEVLAGSLQPGLPAVLSNHHIWFDPNLVVVPPTPTSTPEPASLALLAAGLIGLRLRRRA